MGRGEEENDRAPVFEGYVHPDTAAGEIQAMGNIADAVNDQRDPVRRLYGRIMLAVAVGPFVLFVIIGLAQEIFG